ncbi:MBOAT family O-acyltransferase [Clostridium sp. 'White wine YQ']|uniref:MBOAT family O-acyltransferase n=1 Tax=Clostridium sp. 'White wine YQ' TaxID=3027474 RepID=UPI00236636DA|nr:MBOAT family O-acyltransferase [Clostridium sp. 'White wine YQ']MDD7795333.1 MBOAT family protein [Clostridium sp. 'White wine YQ']
MIFNSISFLIFFPIVVVIYFIIPLKIRWVWLLITSYYFYMCWNPKYVLLLGVSTIVTYLSGILIENADKMCDEKKSITIKKMWVFTSFISNLGVLFLFKYYNFFNFNIKRVLSIFNISIVTPTFDFLLPLGISFYTLQALSYTMDVYRGDVKVEKSLGKYALFVSFFPQLVAGPIGKSKNLLNQFNENHYFDYDRVKNGLLLMLWGFFQKLFVADRLAILVNTVYNNPANYKGFQTIIATVFFTFQIYCDFSSYSDIAIGAAEVMGFRLKNNFKQPYFSRSIKDFWRRWHVSLSAWFKDYLYIPLGGNRRGKLRTYINIMIVFLLSGLWHGAAINFIIWGALHGTYQVLGDMFKPMKIKLTSICKVRTEVFSYKLLQVLVTFALVNFAWIFFRASSFNAAKIMIRNMICFNPWMLSADSISKLGIDSKDFLISILGIAIVLIINVMQAKGSLRVKLAEQNTVFRWAVYFSCIIFILIFGVYGEGYNPQQFIYSQF